ncbi:MAG: 2-isopropylmalate synthase [Nevskiaceae bacterium]|nr:MAG: 2-isopropylmalate synthase [Nevskiaceae bacterium]TBR74674.1 MAG: 2-isopropylmalate synthase [Nevskiaceae bacterium]
MTATHTARDAASAATERVIIFDTTLRDGEQSPGAAMTQDAKLRVARQLERLRVDVIEAGFAAASPGDFKAVEAVAKAIIDSTVCSLARANAGDVHKAGEAIKPARHGRIHTFIATSPIHMEKKLRMAPDQVVESAIGAVKLAREYTDDVEFSAEDAVRSEMDFLVRIFTAAIEAGATTINVPDTVGYSVPEQWGTRMAELIRRVPGADRVVWSTHCHNDLGMAVANSLAAVRGGARQVECTINGLGERAGNASLEEVVMALRTRRDVFSIDTRIDATQIVPASRLVSSITGYVVQPNKAVVGANAFAHESGIHQDGVLKNRETYEIMRAQDVGWDTNRLTLGKLSGRNAFRARLAELGHVFTSDAELAQAFARFKDLADKKHEIYDEDLLALVAQTGDEVVQEHFKLARLGTVTSTGSKPSAVVAIDMKGREVEAVAEGNGAVDAVFLAIEKLVESGAQLILYAVNNITAGADAQGEVTVRLSRDGHVVNGNGADTDILVASAKAYINALNHLGTAASRKHPQAFLATP